MEVQIPSNKPADICDYIECDAFINGSSNITDSFMSGESDDEEGEDYNTRLRSIKDILERRLNLYKPYSPFSIIKNQVVSNFNSEELRKDNLHYFFCLHYSLNGGSNLNRAITTLFEYIVDSALKEYLNTPYSFMTSFGENESNLKEKIHSVLEQTNEKIGNLEMMPSHAKDGGIDILTFKPLDDRGNQFVVLTDATLGKNWNVKKVHSKLEHWREYIHFKVQPITCLAIAKIIPIERFHYASKENGLLFDRARIMSYYNPSEDIQDELEKWRSSI